MMFKILNVSERNLFQLIENLFYKEDKVIFETFINFYKSQYGSLVNLFEMLFTDFSNNFVKLNSEFNNLSTQECYRIINMFNNTFKNIDINKIYVIDIYDLLFREPDVLNIKIDDLFYSYLYEFIESVFLNDRKKINEVFDNIVYVIDKIYSFIECHLIYIDYEINYSNNYYIYINNVNNNLIFVIFLDCPEESEN